jgi:iron(III) transport system substrate-binding protein
MRAPSVRNRISPSLDKKIESVLRAGWFFLALLTILASAQAMAASVEETLDKLNRLPASERQTAMEREARKESRVVFYTTFNVADLQDLKRLFEQRYPFVTLEPFRLGHGRLAEKIRTETLAGKLEADAISIPGLYSDGLRTIGAVAPNRTPLRNQLLDGFTDKDGWFTGLYSTAYVLQYNTKLVKSEELPKNWNEVLQEKWKGQLAIDQEGYEWFAGLLDTLGEEKGMSFARQLATREIAVRRGHTLLSQLVAAGEFKIVLEQYDHIAYRAVKAGSPTNYAFMNPILSELPNGIWATKTSPRPYAAALLMDFLLLKETQQFFAQRGRRMAHREVAYLPNPPAHYRWSVPNPAKWGPRYNDLIKSYREIFLTK